MWLIAVKDRNENGCCVMAGNVYMWIENNTDKKECFRMDMVAVLIPCYNEAKTIEKVVKDYLKVLPENSKIYVYDNNSSDGTGEIA